MAEQAEEAEAIEVRFKWASKSFSVSVYPDDTVGELKRRISEVTHVLPKRQKLVGLKAQPGGKQTDDHVLVRQLNIKPSSKLMMVG